ncbi:MAG TPA: glycoside hydrolase family 19 protein [Pseudonocardiaceae bacterium]|nr:glycoside hydrolase family 19 protein [Pseudonocardiaceae bacterium]
MSIRLVLAGLASLAMAAALTFVVPAAPASADPACATAWSSTAVYTGGMTASFNGHNYQAKWWTQGEQPPGTSGVWADQGTCGGSTPPPGTCDYPQWVAGTSYVAGDIVQYPANGQYYQATHDNPGYDPTISTWYWSPYSCGGGGGNPPPSGFVVSEAQFDQMFPSRNAFYTYSGLVSAMSAYPGFATTGGDTVEKQEAAAFLANVSHETGGLVYINEIDQSGDYCASESYGCPAGTYSYYGRGPLQLSWNFNYYAAGNALGIDLLDNPSLVATDAATSWKTALWYWDTQTGPGTMTGHNAMVNGAGFGQTIWSINGSIECNGGNTAEMQDRVNLYEQFTQILGVPAGSNLTC